MTNVDASVLDCNYTVSTRQSQSLSIVNSTDFEQSRSITVSSLFATASQSLAKYIQAAVENTASMNTSVITAADAQSIADVYGYQAQNVPSFVAVYVVETEDGFECTSILDHATREDRFYLYDLELKIRTEIPDVSFYFDLVDYEDGFELDSEVKEALDGVFEV